MFSAHEQLLQTAAAEIKTTPSIIKQNFILITEALAEKRTIAVVISIYEQINPDSYLASLRREQEMYSFIQTNREKNNVHFL